MIKDVRIIHLDPSKELHKAVISNPNATFTGNPSTYGVRYILIEDATNANSKKVGLTIQDMVNISKNLPESLRQLFASNEPEKFAKENLSAFALELREGFKEEEKKVETSTPAKEEIVEELIEEEKSETIIEEIIEAASEEIKKTKITIKNKPATEETKEEVNA